MLHHQNFQPKLFSLAMIIGLLSACSSPNQTAQPESSIKITHVSPSPMVTNSMVSNDLAYTSPNTENYQDKKS